MNGALEDTPVEIHQKAARPTLKFTCTDQDGAAINLASATIKFVVYDIPTKTQLFDLTTTAGEITIGGASTNVVTCTLSTAETVTAGTFRYELRRTSTANLPLFAGPFIIHESVGSYW